jgi:hypothetical protein
MRSSRALQEQFHGRFCALPSYGFQEWATLNFKPIRLVTLVTPEVVSTLHVRRVASNSASTSTPGSANK